MKSHLTLRSAVLASASLSCATAVMADSDEWLCDSPAHNNPPVGCSMWGAKGLCTAYPLTQIWHCISGWAPSPGGGGGVGHTAEKTLRSHNEFALLKPQDSMRSARLVVDIDAVLLSSSTQAQVLDFVQDGAQARSVHVLTQRNHDGSAELRVVSREAGAETLLARLPMRKGLVTVIAEWRNDPVNGPRLSLASGITAIEVSLPKLDAQTRLNVWKSATSQVWFDIERGAVEPDATRQQRATEGALKR